MGDLNLSHMNAPRVFASNRIDIKVPVTVTDTIFNRGCNIVECNIDGGISCESNVKIENNLFLVGNNINEDVSQVKRIHNDEINIDKTSAITSFIKTSEKSIVINSELLTQITFFNDHSFLEGDNIIITGHDNTIYNAGFIVKAPISEKSFFVASPVFNLSIGSGGTCSPEQNVSLCTVTTNKPHNIKIGDTVIARDHSNALINNIPLIVKSIGNNTLDVLVNSTYTGGIGGYLKYAKYTHVYETEDGSLGFQKDMDTEIYSLSNDTRKYSIIGDRNQYIKNIEQFGKQVIQAELQTKKGSRVISISNSNKHELQNGDLVKFQLQTTDNYSVSVNGLNIEHFRRTEPYTIDTSFDSIMTHFDPDIPYSYDMTVNQSNNNHNGNIYSVSHGLTTGDLIQIAPNTITGMILGLQTIENPGIFSSTVTYPGTLPTTTLFEVNVIDANHFEIMDKDTHLQFKIIGITIKQGTFVNYQTVLDIITTLQENSFLINLTQYTSYITSNAILDGIVQVSYEHLEGDLRISTYGPITNNGNIVMSGIKTSPPEYSRVDNVKWNTNIIDDSTFHISTNIEMTSIDNYLGKITNTERDKLVLNNDIPNHVYLLNTDKTLNTSITNDRFITLHTMPFTQSKIRLINNDSSFFHTTESSDGINELIFLNGDIYNSSKCLLNRLDQTDYLTYNSKTFYSELGKHNTTSSTVYSSNDKITIPFPNSNHNKYINASCNSNKYLSFNTYFKMASVIDSANISSNILTCNFTHPVHIDVNDVISVHTDNDTVLVSGNLSSNITNETSFSLPLQGEITISTVSHFKINGDLLYTSNDGSLLYNDKLDLGTGERYNKQGSNHMIYKRATQLSDDAFFDKSVINSENTLLVQNISSGQKIKLNTDAFVNSIDIPLKNNRISGIPSWVQLNLKHNNNDYISDKHYLTHNFNGDVRFSFGSELFAIANDDITITGMTNDANIEFFHKERTLNSQDEKNELCNKYKILSAPQYQVYTHEPENLFCTPYELLKTQLVVGIEDANFQLQMHNVVIQNNSLNVENTHPVTPLYIDESSDSLRLFTQAGNSIEIDDNSVVEDTSFQGSYYGNISLENKIIHISSAYIELTSQGYQLVINSDNHGLYMNDVISIHRIFLNDTSTNDMFDLADKFVVGDPNEDLQTLPDNQFRINLSLTIDAISLLVQIDPYCELKSRQRLLIDSKPIYAKNTRTIDDSSNNYVTLTTESTEFVEKINNIEYNNNTITIEQDSNEWTSSYLSTRDNVTVKNVYFFREIPSGDTKQTITYQSLTKNTFTNRIEFIINDSSFLTNVSAVILNELSSIYNSTGNDQTQGVIISWVENVVDVEFPNSDYFDFFAINGGTIQYTNINMYMKDTYTSNIDVPMRITSKNIQDREGTIVVSSSFDFVYANLSSIVPFVKDFEKSATSYIDKVITNDTFRISTLPSITQDIDEYIFIDDKRYNLDSNIHRQLCCTINTNDSVVIDSNIISSSFVPSYSTSNGKWQSIKMNTPGSITAIGIILSKLNPDILPRGKIYLDIYKENSTNGDFTRSTSIATYNCKTIQSNQFTYFSGLHISVEENDIISYIISNDNDSYNIEYVTNTEQSPNIPYTHGNSFFQNGFIITDLKIDKYGIDFFNLPNVLSRSESTSGTIKIWNNNLLTSGFRKLDVIEPIDIFNGSAVSMSNDGKTICSGCPVYDSGIGLVIVYTFDGDTWNINKVKNPNANKLMKNATITATTYNDEDITLTSIFSQSETTANLISKNITEINFIPCSQFGSPSATSEPHMPIINSTVTLDYNFENSQYNTAIHNQTLTVSNIEENTFTLSNIYAPYEQNGVVFDKTIFDGVNGNHYGNITFNDAFTSTEVKYPVFMDINTKTIMYYETDNAHGIQSGDKLFDQQTNTIIEKTSSIYDSDRTIFVNDAGLGANIQFINLSSEVFGNSFSWANLDKGLILKRKTNNAWSINEQHAFQTNQQMVGDFPISGVYTSSRNNDDSYYTITSGIDSGFGKSVAISGDSSILLVGEPSNDNGYVHIYENISSNIGYKNTIASDNNSNFGIEVYISPNGKTMAIVDDANINIYFDVKKTASISYTSEVKCIALTNMYILVTYGNEVFVYEIVFGKLHLQQIIKSHSMPIQSTGGISLYPSISLKCKTPETGSTGTLYKLYTSSNISGHSNPAYEIYFKSITTSSFSIQFNIANVSGASIDYETHVTPECLSNYELHYVDITYEPTGQLTFKVDDNIISSDSANLVTYAAATSNGSVFVDSSMVFGTPTVHSNTLLNNFGSKITMNDIGTTIYITSDEYIHSYILDKNTNQWIKECDIKESVEDFALNSIDSRLYCLKNDSRNFSVIG